MRILEKELWVIYDVPNSNPLIETKELVKKFGSFTALNGVS